MATKEEKLFVQIFDRKREIIDKLKHLRQLRTQHLLSKVLIEDISPPPWLLNSNSQTSTSDLTGISLFPRVSQNLYSFEVFYAQNLRVYGVREV